MIRITQIAVPAKKLGAFPSAGKQAEEIKKVIGKKYHVTKQEIRELILRKRSLDARKKTDIKYLYTVDAVISGENKLLSRYQEITMPPKQAYQFRPSGTVRLRHRPVVIGFGPAGMFCALELAKKGYEPLVLERGQEMDVRVRDVEAFWAGGPLKQESNVQFGEGGAGTFSDGKLNTLVKDPYGRHQKVLETLAAYGAPAEILYQNKPHIGTDYLRQIVKNFREEIIRLGGEVRFGCRVSGFQVENGRLCGVYAGEPAGLILCEAAVLAVGHSARDTFLALKEIGADMEAKAFAVGFRIEHGQELMNRSQYGECAAYLPPADYKVTYRASNGRNVYSFCMCPGGFVVNASSEPGLLAVNGMSNHDRGERNANSAMIVSVTPEDFQTQEFMPVLRNFPFYEACAGALAPGGSKPEVNARDPLLGVEFQRRWERAAFLAGNGRIPAQRFEDFRLGRKSERFGHITPNTKGAFELSDLNTCLPVPLCDSLKEAVPRLEGKITGFSDPDAVLSGVETRTSSPVRILRDEGFQSNIRGLYPCGEGAGYAGGITSAAMDGLRVYEAVAGRFGNLRGSAENLKEEPDRG